MVLLQISLQITKIGDGNGTELESGHSNFSSHKTIIHI